MNSQTHTKHWWQTRRTSFVFTLTLSLGLGSITTDSALGAHLTGVPATYTLDEDFDEGIAVNVNHNSPNHDQLQLDSQPTPFAFIWVAVSSKGTVVKIDTNTGQVLGEYKTAPVGRALDPSRTTVDGNGNAWVTNRAESSFVDANAIAQGLPKAGGGMGSVVYIGLEENGQCIDRNNNGIIDTSTGLGDVKAWDNAGGVDNLGGVSTAEDECIIHYVRVNSTGTRHVSVDADNNVWVSGWGDRDFDLIDSNTGAIVRQEPAVGFGGYGGLIDSQGVIWSAGVLLRWDVSKPLTGFNGDPGGPSIGPSLPGSNWAGQNSPNSYGLCINPNNGEVWSTRVSDSAIDRYAPDGTHLGAFSHGFQYAQGCVVDSNGHIWVAHSIIGNGNTVGHLDNQGAFLGNITVGSGPTGVAVDANGKIWATNYFDGTVSRIDPSLNGGIGAVDLTTANLGGNLYNYSDMTGSTLVAPPNNGTWSIVHDSNVAGKKWGKVSWNALEPGNSSILVTAASSPDGVTFGPAQPVTNGVNLSVADGQFLRISVSFSRSTTTDADGDGIGDSPVLYDLSIKNGERSGQFSCRATDLRVLGIELGVANAPDAPCKDESKTLVTANLSVPGLVTVKSGTIHAATEQTPDDIVATDPAVGDNGLANASVEDLSIKVGLTSITADVLNATAKVECSSPIGSIPSLTGSSLVTNVKLNGNPIATGSAPVDIPIPLVGTLHINHQAVMTDTLTQRAIWLEGTGLLSAVQVVVSEAKADFAGNPCQ